MNKFVVFFIFCLWCSKDAFSQAQSPVYGDPLQDAVIVGSCAVGGAVLGLSTLPFTEEPGDHLNNVLVGGAIGLIVGVGFVAWSQASVTQGEYSLAKQHRRQKGFLGPERAISFGEMHSFKQKSFKNSMPQIQFSFKF